MKKISIIFLVTALAACGNNSSDTDSATIDTSFSGPVILTDTTGVHEMNADTTGMGNAR